MTRDRIPQHGSRTRLLTVAGVILLAAGLSGALLPPMQTAPSIGFRAKRRRISDVSPYPQRDIQWSTRSGW